jgi:hypothetical protein
VDEALYLPRDGLYQPTRLTQGPWSKGAQHGGPPAALLARAIEAESTPLPMQLVRLTVELMRPVPLDPLTVDVEVIRPGKRVRLVRASLLHDDVAVASAIALQIRTDSVAVPESRERPPPGPDNGTAPTWPQRWPSGYHDTAVDMRFIAGDPSSPGPATAWIRLKVPVVAGEEPSGVQRAAAAADFGNGISSVLDPAGFVYINPDLTVYLHRKPRGEWICLEATTTGQPSGIGLAESALYDIDGAVGHSLQGLLIGPVAQ